jgi:hypothetical protein
MVTNTVSLLSVRIRSVFTHQPSTDSLPPPWWLPKQETPLRSCQDQGTPREEEERPPPRGWGDLEEISRESGLNLSNNRKHPTVATIRITSARHCTWLEHARGKVPNDMAPSNIITPTSTKTWLEGLYLIFTHHLATLLSLNRLTLSYKDWGSGELRIYIINPDFIFWWEYMYYVGMYICCCNN